MQDEQTIEVKDVIEAPIKAAEAVSEKVADTVAEVAKTVAVKTKPIAAKAAKIIAPKAVKAPRKAKRSVAKARKAIKAAPRKITAAATKRPANKRTIAMTNFDFFKGFDALPTFAPFQDAFAKANENGQQFAERGQKVAQELADLARANVEAVVEAGRVASEGTRALTQDAVSSGREGFEKAADAIRALAEAKSPTEYLQLQAEIARTSFDRFVAEGSKITESMVKLAGEAFQPISNRASANAERFNTLVA